MKVMRETGNPAEGVGRLSFGTDVLAHRRRLSAGAWTFGTPR